MRPSILFATIALFSQIGGIEAQEECQMNTPSRLDISANNTFKVTVTYPYDFSCNITVEIDNAADGKVYGSTNCVNYRCEKFEIKSPPCSADYVLKPQCVGYNEKCFKHPTRSQPFTFVQPCVEANTIMAITWNPQSYSIVRLEVRDSTGDLVVTRSDIVNTPNTPSSVFITAPPVGIYEVTVFGEDSGESEIKNFNESAMFITKQDNPPHQFRFTALPIDKNISACFSSAIKDVSYWCQHNSGPIMPCIDCVSYRRENGTGTITIYTEGGVKLESFQYRV